MFLNLTRILHRTTCYAVLKISCSSFILSRIFRCNTGKYKHCLRLIVYFNIASNGPSPHTLSLPMPTYSTTILYSCDWCQSCFCRLLWSLPYLSYNVPNLKTMFDIQSHFSASLLTVLTSLLYSLFFLVYPYMFSFFTPMCRFTILALDPASDWYYNMHVLVCLVKIFNYELLLFQV